MIIQSGRRNSSLVVEIKILGYVVGLKTLTDDTCSILDLFLVCFIIGNIRFRFFNFIAVTCPVWIKAVKFLIRIIQNFNTTVIALESEGFVLQGLKCFSAVRAGNSVLIICSFSEKNGFI